jgi:DNA-binding SARP family transcriptional activator
MAARTTRRRTRVDRGSANCSRRVGSLRLQLLGGFEFLLDESPVQLPLGARRVVAFLALHPRPVQRIYVASNLWPDSTEERAHASLRTALWQLGPQGLVLATATTAQLALASSVYVDVHDAAVRATRLVHRSGPGDLNDLTCLCNVGELLPDWYDEWVLIERERFHQLRVHALEALCEQCAADGRFGQAAEAGLAAVASDPLRESAHRAVIAAYLAEDNPADAVRQYSLYRFLAREQLGIEPSLRMQGLVQGLPVETTDTRDAERRTREPAAPFA